jgi:hypothetical protein
MRSIKIKEYNASLYDFAVQLITNSNDIREKEHAPEKGTY